MDYVLNIIPQMMDGCLVSFQVFIITIVLSIPLAVFPALNPCRPSSAATFGFCAAPR